MDPNTTVAVVAASPAPDAFLSMLLTVGSLALGGVTWAMTHLGLWVASKIKSEKIRAIWLRADDFAARAVKEVYQSYVEPLKKAGKWDAESAATAKRMAVEKVKEMLSWQHGVHALSYVFAGDEKALDNFAGTFVESAVLDVAREGSIVQASTAPTATPSASAPFPAARADGSRPINPTPAPVVP